VLDLHQGILEEFAQFAPRLVYSAGFCVRSPAKQQEQTAAWKAAHPAAVRAHRTAYNRAHGVGPKLRGAADPRSRPFVDQHGTQYGSLTEAVHATGIAKGTISKVLRGVAKSARGLVFRYAA
jgi:hypothetical protein